MRTSLFKGLVLAGLLVTASFTGNVEGPASRPTRNLTEEDFTLIRVRDAVSLYFRWVEAEPG